MIHPRRKVSVTIKAMQLGKLTFDPITDKPELIAEPIRKKLGQGIFHDDVFVASIEPELADTATFCARYDIPLEVSANCIIVEAKRADKTWYAVCMVLATNMLDVNNKVRRILDARKASFAPRDATLQLTGMEYGGITPLGLPEGWPILVDEKVAEQEYVVLGGGIRGSKILAKTSILTGLRQAKVLDITK